MITKILNGVYQLEIPLPRNPLRMLNSYLIKGEGRSLLVDTGLNSPEGKEAQLKAMKELGIEWSEVDFFITHVHGDHSGLVYALAHRDSRVYCTKTDADCIKSTLNEPDYWKALDDIYIQHGYPPQEMRSPRNTVRSYFSGSDICFTYIQDGDMIGIGEFNLICIATPGHSPGHMCLYEPKHKFLLGGDHILNAISPNIGVWLDTDDSLGQYLISLDRVDSMDISIILPGHRGLITDYHRRIAELKHHHENRLGEILDILKEEIMNAYQIASRMHWDAKYDSWDEFPSYQKWFATGEVIAHLDYLSKRTKVKKTLENHKFIYERL